MWLTSCAVTPRLSWDRGGQAQSSVLSAPRTWRPQLSQLSRLQAGVTGPSFCCLSEGRGRCRDRSWAEQAMEGCLLKQDLCASAQALLLVPGPGGASCVWKDAACGSVRPGLCRKFQPFLLPLPFLCPAWIPCLCEALLTALAAVPPPGLVHATTHLPSARLVLIFKSST